MKCLVGSAHHVRRCIRVLIIVLSVFALFEPRETRAQTPEGDDAEVNTFLINLYEGFLARGEIAAPEAPSDAAPWTVGIVRQLLSAIERSSFASDGGYITSEAVYSRAALVSVEALDGLQFRVTISEAGLPHYSAVWQSSFIPSNCRVEQFASKSNPSQDQIVRSVLCLFSTKLREKLFARKLQPQEFSYDFVTQSGVERDVQRYFDSLRNAGVITAGRVRIKELEASVTLPGLSPLPIQLLPGYVSPYRSPEDAAAALQNLLTVPRPTLIAVDSSSYSFVPTSELIEALSRAADASLSDGAERSTAFQGAPQPQLIAQPPGGGIPGRPCSYSAGVVTPCNNKVLDFYGYDPENVMGGIVAAPVGFRLIPRPYARTKSLLGSLGYQFQRVKVATPLRAANFDEQIEFSKFAGAETVFINAHGDDAGRFYMQCYSDVLLHDVAGRYISQSCCERLKATALGLGLPGASTIDCVRPENRPFQDPSGSLQLASQAACTPVDAQGRRAKERCQIIATSAFYSNIGAKAAVLTAQCSGGRCAALAGQIPVMDFVSESPFVSLVDLDMPTVYDDRLLASDLSGDANYCVNTTSAHTPTHNEDMWGVPFTGNCIGANVRAYPGSPSPFRTIQNSRTSRGAGGVYGDGRAPCSSLFSWNGLHQYCAMAEVGGAPLSQVEFAPSIQRVDYDESTRVLNLIPTSKMHANCSLDVSTEGGAPSTTTNTSSWLAKSCGVNGASVRFSGDPGIVPSSLWGSPPADLRAAYGHDQSSWPWYLKVVLTGSAPNGAPLIGNQGAPSKWLWPVPQPAPDVQVSPYLSTLGMSTSGGTRFEIWIPVLPSTTCCMPKIEWTGNPPTPSQNGCECQQDVGQSGCFMGTCVTGNSTDGYSQIAIPGMRADSCGGRYRPFPGTWRIWHDCCPVSVQGVPMCEQTTVETFERPENCVDRYPYQAISHNYIQRPWDTSAPAQCEPIMVTAGCGGG